MRKILFLLLSFLSQLSYAQTHNGHEYVDLGLPQGNLWATCNIGASYPGEYGNYYAWGETNIKASYDWSNYFDCIDSYGKEFKTYFSDGEYFLSPNSHHDVAREKWGGSWIVPGIEDFFELIEECQWKWTTSNGHKGYKVTGPNGNSIFFPAAGGCMSTDHKASEVMGLYWANEINPDKNGYAMLMGFNENDKGLSSDQRYFGLCVRPVLYKDLLNQNTSSTSSGTTPCQVCFGSGRIQMGPAGPWVACTGCGGSGQWMTNVPVVPTVPQGSYGGGNNGSTYNGSSSSGNQGNSSIQNRPQTAKECGVCHGTGKCQTCNGTGRANNLMDLGTHQCVNCKSNVGKCQWCRGTGKQI